MSEYIEVECKYYISGSNSKVCNKFYSSKCLANGMARKFPGTNLCYNISQCCVDGILTLDWVEYIKYKNLFLGE